MYNVLGTDEKRLKQFISMKRAGHLLLNAFSEMDRPVEIRQFLAYIQQFDESYYKKKKDNDEPKGNK